MVAAPFPQGICGSRQTRQRERPVAFPSVDIKLQGNRLEHLQRDHAGGLATRAIQLGDDAVAGRLHRRVAAIDEVNRARLIAISTTSGTGSEVTPFAVLTDKERGRKVTLADYSLSPDVAIVDPQFVISMPKGLTADTGIDCLTHALEAAVSSYASAYTDSNAMQAIRLAFKYLPIAYEHPRDEEARSMMHNAACIAAMAFANASVGVNHALAHAFGAHFHVAHGRANALMLPHVIAYNASVPMKFLPSPYQKGYVANKKYATISDLLGLGGHTIDEKVKNLVAATEQLLDQLGFPRSIAELGISKEEFERAMP